MSQQDISADARVAHYLDLAAKARREAGRSKGEVERAYLSLARQWEWLAKNATEDEVSTHQGPTRK